MEVRLTVDKCSVEIPSIFIACSSFSKPCCSFELSRSMSAPCTSWLGVRHGPGDRFGLEKRIGEKGMSNSEALLEEGELKGEENGENDADGEAA